MHVEAILKDCQPTAVKGDLVTLGARSPFHKEQLEDARSKQLVGQVISASTGQSYRIQGILASEGGKKAPKTEDKIQAIAEDPVVKAALELGAKIVDVK